MSGSSTRGTSNDGDAFAESLAEAEAPGRARHAGGVWKPPRKRVRRSEESVARTVELLREGDLAAARANRSERHAAGVRGVPREEPGRRGAVGGVQRGGLGGRRRRPPPAASDDHHRRARGTGRRGRVRLLISRGITRSVARDPGRLAVAEGQRLDRPLRPAWPQSQSGDLTRRVAPATARSSTSAATRSAGSAAPSTRSARTPPRRSTAYNADARPARPADRRAVRRAPAACRGRPSRWPSTSEEAGRAVGEIASAVADVAQGAERQVRMVEPPAPRSRRPPARADAAPRPRWKTAAAAERARELAETACSPSGTPPPRSATRGRLRAGRRRDRRAVGALGADRRDRRHDRRDRRPDQPAGAERRDRGRPRRRAGQGLRGRRRGGPQAGRGVPGGGGPDRRPRRQIQTETGRPVDAVADSSERTGEGVATVERAREAFEAIGNAVEDVSARVGQIAGAVRQIATEAGRAEQDVSEVAAVAEQSSASARAGVGHDAADARLHAGDRGVGSEPRRTADAAQRPGLASLGVRF